MLKPSNCLPTAFQPPSNRLPTDVCHTPLIPPTRLGPGKGGWNRAGSTGVFAAET